MRAERWPVRLPAIACLLAIAACVDRTPEPSVRAPPPPLETVAVAPAPPPPATPPPRPARKPAPPSTTVSLEPAPSTPGPAAPSGANPASPPAVEPAAQPEPPAQDVLMQLDGRDQSGVADLLGEPQARDEAAPATIWRYVSHDCELDVYFYLDLKAKEMRALHYEVKGNDTSDRPQQCYAQLVADKRARLNTAGSPDRPR